MKNVRERAKSKQRRIGLTVREELYMAVFILLIVMMTHARIVCGDAGPLWWQGVLLVSALYYLVKLRFTHKSELKRIEREIRLSMSQKSGEQTSTDQRD